MRLVLVMSLKFFDDFTLGELRWLYMTHRVAALVANDYLRVMWDPNWEVSDGNSDNLPDRLDQEVEGVRQGPGTEGPGGDGV